MSSFQIQIVSDLHLETPKTRPSYSEFKIEPRCQYLALLGDIGNVSDTQFFNFLQDQLRQFDVVFYLLGNHEPYGTTFPAARARVRAFETNMNSSLDQEPPGTNRGRFVFLDQTRYDLTDSDTVLGCTLHSRILPEQFFSISRFVTDFHKINDWTVESHIAAYDADVGWLNNEVNEITNHEPHRMIVIFTHYSPTTSETANDPKHIEDPNQVQSAFVTDMTDQVCWNASQVRLWAFGHTHFNCDFVDTKTKKRLVANQKGYRRAEGITFNEAKVVNIEVNTVEEKSEIHKSRNRRQATQRSKKCIVLGAHRFQGLFEFRLSILDEIESSDQTFFTFELSSLIYPRSCPSSLVIAYHSP